MKLTATQIAKLKPDTKMKRYSDGNGLYLQIEPAGGKYWRRKYRMDGKEKIYSLGKYPAVSLADARRENEEASRLLAQGIDPSLFRKQNQQASPDTFANIADEWLARQTDKSESTARKNRHLIEKAKVVFGHCPLEQIKPVMVLGLCRSEEEKGYHEQAHRLKSKCSQIFRYAIATGRLESDPTRDLTGALKPVITTHRAAITDVREIPGLLRTIDGYQGEINTLCALRLAPLLFVRPGELRNARWQDIDLERAEWRYTPAKTRLQTAVDLIVPLSRQALAILRTLQELNGHTPYVFHSSRAAKHGVMSKNTINQALRAMGYSPDEMCGHGFRAMAKTTIREQLGYSDEVTELQLGHRIKRPNGQAYDRTSFLPERQQMMQAWADYLDRLRDDSVIQFSKARAS